MLDLIHRTWARAVRFFTEKESIGDQTVVGSPGQEIPVATLSISSGPVAEKEIQYDFSRWTVTEYYESPFEKVGRLYIEGDNLVIRSDLDNRGYNVPLVDLSAVFEGEPQAVRLLATGEETGIVKLSTSGKAMNFWIDPYLYTSPLMRVIEVLEGRERKAAVFVGREMGI